VAECVDEKFKKENPTDKMEIINKTKKMLAKILANLNNGNLSLFTAVKISAFSKSKLKGIFSVAC